MTLNVTGNYTNFKANTINENSLTCYKSNKGTVAGAILAVPAVWLNLKPAFMDVEKEAALADASFTKLAEAYKKLGVDEKIIDKLFPQNYKEILERQKKFAIPFAIIAGACTLGAGVLFDKIRNKKAAEAVNDLAEGNYNNIYDNGGSVDISKSGVPYYVTDNTSKYGFLSGMACGVVRSVMNIIQNKSFSIVEFVLPVLTFGLGGMMMSAIAKNSTNKAAEKATYM